MTGDSGTSSAWSTDEGSLEEDQQQASDHGGLWGHDPSIKYSPYQEGRQSGDHTQVL